MKQPTKKASHSTVSIQLHLDTLRQVHRARAQLWVQYMRVLATTLPTISGGTMVPETQERKKKEK